MSYIRKLYLDNNILVSIENGELSLMDIYSLFPGMRFIIYFSSAHIFELENITGNKTQAKDYLLNRRFEYIRAIYNNNYLYVDPTSHKIYNIIEDPLQAYNTICCIPPGIQYMKQMCNIVPKASKKHARKSLNLDPKHINNISPDEVIDYFDEISKKHFNSSSIKELVDKMILSHPSGHQFGLNNRIGAYFELLDSLGYWKDKETSKSNYARLWDSQHAFFASYCDYFLTDDKKTKKKSQVVYRLCGIKTKVISTTSK